MFPLDGLPGNGRFLPRHHEHEGGKREVGGGQAIPGGVFHEGPARLNLREQLHETGAAMLNDLMRWQRIIASHEAGVAPAYALRASARSRRSALREGGWNSSAVRA